MQPQLVIQTHNRKMDLLRNFSRNRFLIIAVRKVYLKWAISFHSFPAVWDHWSRDLPICTTVQVWSVSAFVLLKGKSSLGINRKRKGALPVSLPSVSHLLEKLDRNTVGSDCYEVLVSKHLTYLQVSKACHMKM